MALTKKNITFIDGYNVINKWGELKEISRIDLADARYKLVGEMLSLIQISEPTRLL